MSKGMSGEIRLRRDWRESLRGEFDEPYMQALKNVSRRPAPAPRFPAMRPAFQR